MLVHDTTNANSVITSEIYVLAQQREKEAFWDHLRELNGVIDLPWCLIEDINELAHPTEKRGGHNYPLYQVPET